MISREEINSFSLDINILSEEEKEDTRLHDELLKLTLADYKKLTYDFRMMAQAIDKLPSVMFQGTLLNMTVSENGISIQINKDIQFPVTISEDEPKNQAFSEESISKISNDLNYIIGILTARLDSIMTNVEIFLDIRTYLKKSTIENYCIKNDLKKTITDTFNKEQIKLTGLKIESTSDVIRKEYVITEHIEEIESNNILKIIYKLNYDREFIPIDINTIIDDSLKDVSKMISIMGLIDVDKTE